MSEHSLDERRCPLCGADNRCALAAGEAPESCWCSQVKIDPQTLAAIPAAAVARCCICPACAGAGGGTTVAR
jgi:hypothetical protein